MGVVQGVVNVAWPIRNCFLHPYVDLCKDKKSSQDKAMESKDEGDTLHEN